MFRTLLLISYSCLRNEVTSFLGPSPSPPPELELVGEDPRNKVGKRYYFLFFTCILLHLSLFYFSFHYVNLLETTDSDYKKL